MRETSIVCSASISGCNPALKAVARCIGVIANADATRRISDQQYDLLIANIEEFLLSENGRGIPTSALAELVIREHGERKSIPLERGLRYLFEAAEDGYLNAQVELALLASRGELLPPEYWNHEIDRIEIAPEEVDIFNTAQATIWWRKAAENGSADAQHEIGMDLIDSKDLRQFAEGTAWLYKAAYNDHPSGGAAYDLAYLMELGCVTPDDPRGMFRLYELAAQTGITEAMLALAHYFENGIGVTKDLKVAVSWYLKAAEGGHDEGHLLAALISGDTGQLEKAVTAGYLQAMLILGPRYLERGLSWDGFEDFRRGLYLYEDFSHHQEVLLDLAYIYKSGEFLGVSMPVEHWMHLGLEDSERLERALACFEAAQTMGWPHATEEITQLRTLLNIDDDDRV